jgi:hypothetical protein
MWEEARALMVSWKGGKGMGGERRILEGGDGEEARRL